MTPKWYILLAIVSGLTIVAFNKPKVYEELNKLISKVLLYTIPIVFIWYIGFKWACSELTPLIDPTKTNQAKEISEKSLYSIVWVIFVFIAFVYLEFLSWLAKKVTIHDSNDLPK